MLCGRCFPFRPHTAGGASCREVTTCLRTRTAHSMSPYQKKHRSHVTRLLPRTRDARVRVAGDKCLMQRVERTVQAGDAGDAQRHLSLCLSLSSREVLMCANISTFLQVLLRLSSMTGSPWSQCHRTWTAIWWSTPTWNFPMLQSSFERPTW